MTNENEPKLQNIVQNWDEDPDGQILLVKPRGLPQLNPLYEAALIERVQFDGDIPELRSGPAPQGVTPAVSVESGARDPVALGWMLNQAASVGELLKETDRRRIDLIEGYAEGTTTNVASQKELNLLLEGRSRTTDIPEYPRGQVPAPVATPKPSGSLLLSLSSKERRQNAWKFLSTTQGRRSAIAGITEMVMVRLQKEGLSVSSRPHNPKATETVQAVHEWTVGIDGPGAVQSAFNLMDMAAASLSKGLVRESLGKTGPFILEIVTINTVDIRTVGWAGRLLK